jgi:biopolymer transport protein ExbD
VRIQCTEDGDSSEVINVSSLLDVMFILIIFFLATTTFKEEERDVQVSLPQDIQGETLTSSDRVIVINIRKSGTYVMLDRQVTIEEMAELVKVSLVEDPKQKILIRADQEALHGYVARAVATCKHAGVGEANIGYQIPGL